MWILVVWSSLRILLSYDFQSLLWFGHPFQEQENQSFFNQANEI